jgi:hypothetical protein
MNEALSAMILSLLESAQKHIADAGIVRNGRSPDSVWIANMVTAQMLNATAAALSAGRDSLR